MSRFPNTKNYNEPSNSPPDISASHADYQPNNIFAIQYSLIAVKTLRNDKLIINNPIPLHYLNINTKKTYDNIQQNSA